MPVMMGFLFGEPSNSKIFFGPWSAGSNNKIMSVARGTHCHYSLSIAFLSMVRSKEAMLYSMI